jgi:hypothetical protein
MKSSRERVGGEVGGGNDLIKRRIYSRQTPSRVRKHLREGKEKKIRARGFQNKKKMRRKIGSHAKPIEDLKFIPQRNTRQVTNTKKNSKIV